ncbi:MAG: hypothetical protein IJ303_03420 [Clostridia bacterium]|nr:hypothetical protein [Clostridia bacterium]
MLIHTIDDAAVRGIEYHEAAAITPKIGMLLKNVNGKLTTASGTDKPTYLCLCEREVSLSAGEVIPVHRLDSAFVLEDETELDLSEIPTGSKLTIGEDGTHLAIATGGAIELVYKEEKPQGGYIARIRIS